MSVYFENYDEIVNNINNYEYMVFFVRHPINNIELVYRLKLKGSLSFEEIKNEPNNVNIIFSQKDNKLCKEIPYYVYLYPYSNQANRDLKNKLAIKFTENDIYYDLNSTTRAQKLKNETVQKLKIEKDRLKGSTMSSISNSRTFNVLFYKLIFYDTTKNRRNNNNFKNININNLLSTSKKAFYNINNPKENDNEMNENI
jgi:hypothetical protein